MKQLFFRFYAGIALVLASAALFLGYVSHLEDVNRAKTRLRNIYYPMILKARNRLADLAGSPNLRERALEDLRGVYPFQVKIEPTSAYYFAPAQLKHLRGGRVVRRNTYTRAQLYCMLNGEELLVFGPLDPLLARGLAPVIVIFLPALVLVGLAIFLLLRSLQRRILELAQVAQALGEGRLEARADVVGGDSLDTLCDGFNRMADRIQLVLNGREELLRTAFHEIRTPLTRLMFLLSEARNSAAEGQPEALFMRMDRSLGDIKDLVEELREEVVADMDCQEWAWVDVPGLLQDVCDAVEMDGPEIETCCDLAIMAGMETALRRALMNLVTNSLRYARTTVRISAYARNGRVFLTVEDDGPGIPEREWDKVFQPGYRVSGDWKGGTGFGLSLVRRIADRHGGEATLQDSPLGGAMFTLSIAEAAPYALGA